MSSSLPNDTRIDGPTSWELYLSGEFHGCPHVFMCSFRTALAPTPPLPRKGPKMTFARPRSLLACALVCCALFAGGRPESPHLSQFVVTDLNDFQATVKIVKAD